MTRLWLSGLLGLLALTAIPAAPVAGVWLTDGLPSPADPASLPGLLTAVGYTVETLTTADLLSPDKLDPKRLQVVVMPYGPAYPIAGRAALEAYLKGGGSYLALGGPSFTRPLVEVDGRFMPWDEFGAVTVSPTPSADATHGPQDSLELSGDGSDAVPWRVSVPDLQGWAYANFALDGLSDADAGLVFDARGDGATRLLALEIVEQDGSRWKQVVELSEAWQTYRLHLSGFASYASPQRNGPDDGLRPSRATRLSLGFTKGMVGAGPHSFGLRNVSVRRAAVPAGTLTAIQIPDAVNSAARRYFATDADGLRRVLWPTCFDATRRAADGWSVAGPTPPGDPSGLFPHRGTPDWRLLRPGDDPAAGIVTHHAGPYRGSDWAALGRDRLSKADLAALPTILRELAGSPAVSPLEIASGVFEGEAVTTGTLTIANRAAKPLTTTVRLRDDAGELLAEEPVELAAKGFGIVDLPLATDRDLTRRVSLVAELDGVPLLDAPKAALDVRASLRELADFFVAAGADDGKFSGISFIDNRGARTLLGAWRIFGDRRYLDSAIAWGRAMVAEQRPDGGYRMGYGINRLGEACYVADGGEIAVGIACLARVTEGDLRETFLKSLDAYMGYREEFRVPTGGIGVGWCLHDYGQRPVVPLDTPTRIYAPERNTYTISCTLAAAYAHAHLRGDDPALVAQCEADADWFIERSKSLYGAGCESFLFAHALSGPARREVYRELLQKQAIDSMTASQSWWVNAGGRSAFNVEGLVYWLNRIGTDPVVEGLLRRAAWAIYGQGSPTSIHRLIGSSDLHSEEWIYLCYSGVGLADLVQPMVTMVGFER